MKTDENLEKVLAATATAHVRYFASASIAENDGYHQIAKLFRAMAEAERIHAINALRIMGELNSTSDNLTMAVDSKTHDFTQSYPTFVEQADQDGNPIASTLFRGAINTTKSHIRLLNGALDNIGRNKEVDYWVCNVCGFIDTGTMPVSCKICSASREKFAKID